MIRLLIGGIFLTLSSVMMLPLTVHALSSNPKMFISADNTFYAYVKAGETISAAFLRVNAHEPFDTVRGDVKITMEGPDAQPQTCIASKDVPVGQGCRFVNQTAAKSGIWRIKFEVPENARTYPEVSPAVRWAKNWFNWNIVVSGFEGEEHGRVWTERYAIRQPPDPQFIDDFTHYYISEDGYIYKATTRGYNGQISTLSADSIGIRKGTSCVSAYQSTDVGNADFSPALGACGNAYKLFFELPAGDLPTKAVQWDKKEDWVRPNISRPSVSELHFISDNSVDQQSGAITFYLRNFIGQYQIKIDVDNDGSFNGQSDVTLNQQMKKLTNSLQRIRFDGADRFGQIIQPSQKIGIKVEITKVAEIHFVAADVEGRTGGLELVRISGDNAPTTLLCWNDTELAPLSADLTTAEIDGRECPNSMGGVHKWAYADASWGNARYIDDWIYAAAKLGGNNQIVYPNEVADVVTAGGFNWLLIGGIIAGCVVFIGAFTFVLIRKRKKSHEPLAAPLEAPAEQDAPPNPDRY